ncbi:MAG: zinc ribbon domain-containing protein [Sulfolobales archaeon]
MRRGEVDKARRKRNSRTPWKQIHRKLSEKAFIAKISPKNTSRTCPQCGYIVKTQVGRIFKCKKCGFKLDRQKLASINIYLKYTRMWGFPHSYEPEISYEGELWVGVTLNGWRPRIRAPMIEALRPMKPREERLISLDINRYETRTP